MMICVTNIQMDAMISSLRRPSLSTKAMAPKVAATFTAHHNSCFSIVQDCANPGIHTSQGCPYPPSSPGTAFVDVLSEGDVRAVNCKVQSSSQGRCICLSNTAADRTNAPRGGPACEVGAHVGR